MQDEFQVIARRSWRPTTIKRHLAFRNCLPSSGAAHAVLPGANVVEEARLRQWIGLSPDKPCELLACLNDAAEKFVECVAAIS